MTIRAILFDLDDTLFDRDDFISKTYGYICDRLGLGEIVSNYMFSEYLEHGENNVFQKAIAKFNLSEDLLEGMILYYRNSAVSLELYDDADEVLSNISEFKTGIVTNGGKETQSNKISILGLTDRVDDIVISGEYFDKAHWKPEPDIFLLAAERLDVLPSECIFIGDKVELDIRGAINSGMIPVLINRDESAPDDTILEKDCNGHPYYEINSLLALDELIAHLG